MRNPYHPLGTLILSTSQPISLGGAFVNFAVAITVARFTSAPPRQIAWLVDKIRVPRA